MPGGVSMHPAAALGKTIGGRRMICLATLVGGDLAWAVPQRRNAEHTCIEYNLWLVDGMRGRDRAKMQLKQYIC